MMNHNLAEFDLELQRLKDLGLFKTMPTLSSANSATITVNQREVINLCSNNYLGLATHPRLKAAAKAAIDRYGVGAGAVKTIAGNLDLHVQLEAALATFKHEEAAMVFQSGFTCNLGVIPAFTSENDLILSDQLNHASIIDGMRLSKAKRLVYQHSDMADLERLLREHRDQYHKVLIITDGVFSMDGDLAKLPEIVALAQRYNALTYVDDAHGSGVMGDQGRGTVDHFKLHGQVDFIIGTLSKAFGVIGGYVAGSQVMKDWLSQKARPLLFSTNLTPADAGALLEAVNILEEDDQLMKTLWANGHHMKNRLREAGLDIGNSATPITPLMLFDEAKTIAFAQTALARGVLVSPIVYPTVPKGQARIRIMVSALHTFQQLDQAADVFIELART
jgi:glycine C-acetyltransferase